MAPKSPEHTNSKKVTGAEWDFSIPPNSSRSARVLYTNGRVHRAWKRRLRSWKVGEQLWGKLCRTGGTFGISLVSPQCPGWHQSPPLAIHPKNYWFNKLLAILQFLWQVPSRVLTCFNSLPCSTPVFVSGFILMFPHSQQWKTIFALLLFWLLG